jgi:hypothetical protein
MSQYIIMQYTISKLDVNKLHDGSVVFIFGSPASGKSWLIKDLLWHKQHNGSRTDNVEDCIFWYKAESHPDFEMIARCETAT